MRTESEQRSDDEEALRARAVALFQQLNAEAPERAQEFGEWMVSRRMRNFDQAKGSALRGVVRKLEKLKDEAEQSGQQGPTDRQEAADVPGETPAADGGQAS